MTDSENNSSAASSLSGTNDAGPNADAGVGGGSVPEPDGFVVQRTRRSPFNPPATEGVELSNFTISRNWASQRVQKKPTGLTRNRKIAGDLPDWAPLPPGELLVKRKAGKDR